MRLIFERRVATTNTSTPVLVESAQVPSDEWWVFDFAALYNESGESVTLQWAIRRSPDLILVSADQTVADGKAYPSTDLPSLMEGEYFVARVTGTAAKGKVTLVLSGAALPARLARPVEVV